MSSSRSSSNRAKGRFKRQVIDVIKLWLATRGPCCVEDIMTDPEIVIHPMVSPDFIKMVFEEVEKRDIAEVRKYKYRSWVIYPKEKSDGF